jgi:cell division protein ZapE
VPIALKTAYAQRLQSGEIKPDQAQAAALETLARLEDDLNAAQEPQGFSLFRKAAPKAARGVYLWGPVGRGKSMLMDLFFESAPIVRKRREHFHAFMAQVHSLIDAWRKGSAQERKALFGQHRGDDPIGPVAEYIAQQARLLCFDELQVTDIADAMILGRLFEALFARNVVLVATSNRPPQDLYKDGINRPLFTPFIDMLQARLDVVAVRGPTDFRLDRLKGVQVYFSPLDPDHQRVFDALWSDLTDGAAETGANLEVLGRTMRLPRACGGFVRVSFASLCAQALGAQDYLALAKRFHTVFLEDIPRLDSNRRNEAKRFVTLIDALYEAGTKLIALAAAQPDSLYPAGDGAFEFERTASRLHEMRSATYLERVRD